MVFSLGLSGKSQVYGQVSQASSYRQVVDELARLDRALCLQAWEQAIDITSGLMASTHISSTYRQELLLFRRQLQQLPTHAVTSSVQPSCDRTSSLFLELPALEASDPPALNWERALANLNYSRPIISLSTTYDPLANLIPAELTADSPEALTELMTPMDTTDSFSVVGDRISWSPQVYSFLARQGDILSLEADVTRASGQGGVQMLLFDHIGNLLKESELSVIQSSLPNYRIPTTNVYFVAVVSAGTVPVFDLQGQIAEWQPASSRSFDYTLTLMGVTPYQALLP